MASNTITTTRDFTIAGSREQAEERIRRAITTRKGKIASADDGLTAKFGSQVMIRLIGGWIAPTKFFPVKATATFAASDAGTDVRIHVGDAMGVGTKKGMTKKYEQAVNELADHLAAA
ncbi:MAG: hypothetical protein ACE37B_04880 [Ilumatobacter sp.]|uniref:hypothetical protein n=1 Tax=Ilumatobacter sp. TaxID=1967498 RepID=UPI0039197268